jgi:hypothetical protein
MCFYGTPLASSAVPFAAPPLQSRISVVVDCLWGRVAQLAEQCPFKAWVDGSNPSALTIKPRLGLYSRLRPSLRLVLRVPWRFASGAERSVRPRVERVVTVLAQLIHPFGNSNGTSDFLALAGARPFILIVTMNWF